MARNDVVLLGDMLERSRQEAVGLSAPEQEAYFVAKHMLRVYRPTHDDILSGLVDGTRDGGIDAIYVVVNGYIIRDDQPLQGLGAGARVDLILLQVKNTRGFSEGAVEKLILHVPELLEFGRDEGRLSNRFNGRVLEVSRRFLGAFRSLDMPSLNIYCGFASLRADGAPNPQVEAKAKDLQEAILSCFGSCGAEVWHMDASQIADMARDRPPTTRELQLAENPISTNTTGGYIGVVNLDEYQKFITDVTGKLDASLFEANVRDYEGATGVNESIQGTLEREDREVDFWWLNNGVTIVADRVQLAGKLMQLESPQVVNGLQTSHEIYKRGARGEFVEQRSVLVKIIQVGNDSVRDRIIRATNSQTALGPSALRATDKVQRQIEEYLQGRGYFYERRKNYYHNRSIPLDKLVSVEQLAQAVMSTLVQVPHLARGEVSRLFEPDVYDLIFNEDLPIEMYGTAISLLRHCETFLRGHPKAKGQVDDFVFHLTMFAAVAGTRRRQPRASDMGEDLSLPDDVALNAAFEIVQDEFAAVARQTGEVLFERLAKNPETSRRLQERAVRYLSSSAR